MSCLSLLFYGLKEEEGGWWKRNLNTIYLMVLWRDTKKWNRREKKNGLFVSHMPKYVRIWIITILKIIFFLLRFCSSSTWQWMFKKNVSIYVYSCHRFPWPIFELIDLLIFVIWFVFFSRIFLIKLKNNMAYGLWFTTETSTVECAYSTRIPMHNMQIMTYQMHQFLKKWTLPNCYVSYSGI